MPEDRGRADIDANSGTPISHLIDTRANNFNLIRLLAALAVLASHSVVVVTGESQNEPLRKALGVTPGSIAVDVFFVASGLLVTASIRRSGSWLDFVVARVVRILPGLVAAVALTGLCIGGYFYEGAGAFLGESNVFTYIFRNSIPFGGQEREISGVFSRNPAGRDFNISLWTLPIEVSMYRWVLLAWLAALLPLLARFRIFPFLIAAAFIYSGLRHLVDPSVAVEFSPARLPFMFFAGALVAVFPDRVRLFPRLIPVLLFAVVLSTMDRRLFFVVYSLSLWYLVLGFAYLSVPPLLAYNRLGDYSYGTYLYAWPIQQAAIAISPALGVAQHISICAGFTLAVAVASWHLIESPMLAKKRRIVEALTWRSTQRPTGRK